MNDFKKRLGENVHKLPEYEFRALRYAETYGIINYQVEGNKMIYSELHAIAVGDYHNYIYTVDLDTFETEVQKPKEHNINKEESRDGIER